MWRWYRKLGRAAQRGRPGKENTRRRSRTVAFESLEARYLLAAEPLATPLDDNPPLDETPLNETPLNETLCLPVDGSMQPTAFNSLAAVAEVEAAGVAHRHGVDAQLHDEHHAPLNANLYRPPNRHLFDPSGGWLTPPSERDPAEIALDFLAEQVAEFRRGDTGPQNFQIVKQYASSHTGVTHIVLQQFHDDLEVAGARINVNVAADGRVLNVASSFVPVAESVDPLGGPADSVTGPATVSLDAVRATFAMAEQLGLVETVADELQAAVSRQSAGPVDGGLHLPTLSKYAIPVGLHYVPQADGRFELAWKLSLRTTDGRHWYDASISTDSGRLLRLNDWASPANHYRVFPFPAANPHEAAHELISDPPAADPTASPFGWHDTNGVAGNDTTTTTGNNVDVFADRDENDIADPGSRPNGTLIDGDLTFDFPVDFSQEPIQYQEAAIVNAFYWTNIAHDIFFRYGFDEAAGNFQRVNYTGVAGGRDAVEVHIQDGADQGNLDNANFLTPPDGSPGIMQLYEFSSFFPAEVVVNSPPELAGSFTANTAEFGSLLNKTGLQGAVAISQPADGCQPLSNAGQIAGNVALIARGDCFFVDKVRHAQDAGATGVIITNNVAGFPPGMAGDDASLVIPAVHISRDDGNAIRAAIADDATVSVTMRATSRRDSAFDHEIIIHEYAHGLTTRLTGDLNASQSSSMGEGWSDWYALMLTQDGTGSQFDATPFGVYSTGNSQTGIRDFAYSFDMAINPLTFGDAAGRFVPHGVGEIWAATLWDLTWLLINGDGGLLPAHGFDADIYDAAGGAGNQLALQLVTDALKLQPSNPTFIEARDAILLADTALTGGANHLAIWTAFARRGLGDGATTPGASSLDVVESFAVPSLAPHVRGDLTVALSVDHDADGVADPGDRLKYDLQVTAANATPQDVLVQIPIDTNSVLVTDSIIVSQGVVTSGNSPGDTVVDIDVGSLLTGQPNALSVSFEVDVVDPLPGTVEYIVHQATISGSNFSLVFSDDPSLDGDGDPTVVPIPQTDLAIEIDVVPDPAIPGETLTFTITATNNGPQDVFGATVRTDFLAEQLVNTTWTCASSPGSICQPAGNGAILDVVDILASGVLEYTFQGTVDLNAADQSIINEAQIESPAVVHDFASANNAAASAVPTALDFGDAPASYVTERPNGPRHVLLGPQLGANRDGESDGRTSADADGDDNFGTSPDDEDGIVFLSSLLPGKNATVNVEVREAAGRLNAWVDFDRDGSFSPTEQIFADLELAIGNHVLSFPVPAEAALGRTFSRFRINSGGGLSFDGFAADGEVEDHPTTIVAPDLAVTLENDVSGNVTLGESWIWKATIRNLGSGEAVFPANSVVLRTRLPDIGLVYGVVDIENAVGLGGDGMIDCTVEDGQLECTATGGEVILSAENSHVQLTLLTTPINAGTFQWPDQPDAPLVDPDHLLIESDETNNSATDSVAVSKAVAAIAIVSDEPNPSLVGQVFTVSVSVDGVVANGIRAAAPTGTVNIGDGDGQLCSISLGQEPRMCEAVLTTAGDKTLQASYGGDENYLPASAEKLHGVDKATTTTSILLDAKSISRRGEAVEIAFAVSVDSPGSGSPTGDVVISDGVESCSADIAEGLCSLTFSTSGSRMLTAIYQGDDNFHGSSSQQQPHFVGLVLDRPALAIGSNTVTVSNVAAGESIHVAVGSRQGSHELHDLGISLGIAEPQIFAVVPVETGVTVAVEFELPAERSGEIFYFQAFADSAAPDVSNLVARSVPLQSADGAGSSAGDDLQPAELDVIASAAIERWIATKTLTEEQQAELANLTFEIAELEGGQLADLQPGTIRVDATAAGHGWFVDDTPHDDVEFPRFVGDGQLSAVDGMVAERVDLLSVILHQLGHALGLPDRISVAASHNLMNGFLPRGARRLPLNHTNFADPSDVNGDGFITPLDVLWVINTINRFGSGAITIDASPADGASGSLLYFDTNGDFEATASDVLAVINRINTEGVVSAVQ